MNDDIYIVMDQNDGIPLRAYHNKDTAEQYQAMVEDEYPETYIERIQLVG